MYLSPVFYGIMSVISLTMLDKLMKIVNDHEVVGMSKNYISAKEKV